MSYYATNPSYPPPHSYPTYPQQQPYSHPSLSPPPPQPPQHQPIQPQSQPQPQQPQPSPFPPHLLSSPNLFRDYYRSELSQLTWNCKNLITHLTIVAGEDGVRIRMGGVVAGVLEEGVGRAPPPQKLPILYVIDSICKNIGPPYPSLFSRFIERSFLNTYHSVDSSLKTKLEELLGTWRTGGENGRELFREGVQAGIERVVFGRAVGRGMGWDEDESGQLGGTDAYQQGYQQLPSVAAPTDRAIVLADVRRLLSLRQSQALLNPADQVNQSQIGALQQLEHLIQSTQLTSDQLGQIRAQLAALGPPPNEQQIETPPLQQPGFDPNFPQAPNPFDQGIGYHSTPPPAQYGPNGLIPDHNHFPSTSSSLDPNTLLQAAQAVGASGGGGSGPYGGHGQGQGGGSGFDLGALLAQHQFSSTSQPQQQSQQQHQQDQYGSLLASLIGNDNRVGGGGRVGTPNSLNNNNAFAAALGKLDPGLLAGLVGKLDQQQGGSSGANLGGLGGSLASLIGSSGLGNINSSALVGALANLTGGGDQGGHLGVRKAGADEKDEEEEEEEGEDPERVAYDEAILELGVELSHSSISQPRPDAYKHLYDNLPQRCRQCGRRFLQGKESSKAMDEHLDYHFRDNQRIQEVGNARAQGRSWFISEEEFVLGENPLVIQRAPSPSATAQAAQQAEISRLTNLSIRAPDDSTLLNKPCPICREGWKSEFDEDREEWVWWNAMEVPNSDGSSAGKTIYHATCLREKKETARLRNEEQQERKQKKAAEVDASKVKKEEEEDNVVIKQEQKNGLDFGGRAGSETPPSRTANATPSLNLDSKTMAALSAALGGFQGSQKLKPQGQEGSSSSSSPLSPKKSVGGRSQPQPSTSSVGGSAGTSGGESAPSVSSAFPNISSGDLAKLSSLLLGGQLGGGSTNVSSSPLKNRSGSPADAAAHVRGNSPGVLGKRKLNYDDAEVDSDVDDNEARSNSHSHAHGHGHHQANGDKSRKLNELEAMLKANVLAKSQSQRRGSRQEGGQQRGRSASAGANHYHNEFETDSTGAGGYDDGATSSYNTDLSSLSTGANDNYPTSSAATTTGNSAWDGYSLHPALASLAQVFNAGNAERSGSAPTAMMSGGEDLDYDQHQQPYYDQHQQVGGQLRAEESGRPLKRIKSEDGGFC